MLYGCMKTLCETVLVNQDTHVSSTQRGNTSQPKLKILSKFNLMNHGFFFFVMSCEIYVCVCVSHRTFIRIYNCSLINILYVAKDMNIYTWL